MSNPLLDFGLSLLAEVIGIAVTVLVIHRLIQRREKRRILPVKRALLSRIQFRCLLLRTWINIATQQQATGIAETTVKAIDRLEDELLDSMAIAGDHISSALREEILRFAETITKLLISARMEKLMPPLFVKIALYELDTILELVDRAYGDF